MILPDWKIVEALKEGAISIDEFDTDLNLETEEIVRKSDMIQPSSVDMHLSDEFVEFNTDPSLSFIDPFDDSHNYGDNKIIQEDGYMLNPGQFILGKTEEKISLPNNIRATVEGRSSWGRLAVIPHTQAGYIDAGYEGNVTLEIVNLGPMTVRLSPGEKFCQFEFARLEAPALEPYNGKYQGDEGVTHSRLHQDKENKE